MACRYCGGGHLSILWSAASFDRGVGKGPKRVEGDPYKRDRVRDVIIVTIVLLVTLLGIIFL